MAEAPRLRVLIADDEPDTVSTLCAILEGEGHTAYAVYKGSEVLSVLRSRNPDVCILDIGLPGPSGFALAKEIREVYGDKAPLLIAVSGKWTGQTDRMLGQLSGFDHYCIKPCDPQELLKLMSQRRPHVKRPDATFGRALAKAADLIGGRPALCEHLGVRARDLMPWISGDVQPPISVFLRAVDILIDHFADSAVQEDDTVTRVEPPHEWPTVGKIE